LFRAASTPGTTSSSRAFRFEKYGIDNRLSNQIVTCAPRESTDYLRVGTENGFNPGECPNLVILKIKYFQQLEKRQPKFLISRKY